MIKINDLLPSIQKFLQTWRVVRICPTEIDAPNETLSFNVLTLTISVAIFLMARISVAGADTSLDVTVIATVVSVVIVFLTGYVVLVFDNSPTATDKARKWGAFFVMLWLTSLLLLVLFDALPFWLGRTGVTSFLIDVIFGPGNLVASLKDVTRAAFFGAAALGILLFKSKRMDPNFRIRSECAIATVLLGFAMNTALMLLFIYAHLV
jgi:hypothetical protein